MKNIFTLVIISVLTDYVLAAQDPAELWSLEKCIQYAHESNLQVKRKQLQVNLAEEDLDQSYFEFLPDLNGGMDHQFSSGRSLNIETYRWENNKKQQGSLGIASNMTIFDGMRNLNFMQYRKYSLLLSREEFEKVKNDITLSIMTAYLQVLFNEELLNIARSQHEVTTLQVLKISKLVEVGNLSKGELLQIKAQAASEKLNIATNEHLLNMSVLELAQILDLDSTVIFKIFHPKDLSVEKFGMPCSVDEIFQQAIYFLPQIKSSEYNVRIAEKNLALQRGQRIPSVNLGGLYYSRYLKGADNPLTPGLDYVYRDQLKNNQYSQLSVGLEIPLFNRMTVQTNITKARIQLRDSELALEQEVQSLYKNIQQVHGNALAAFEKYNAALEAVASNEASFKYTQQKFEVGLVNSVDYNISKADLLKANSDLLQAKYEFIFRMKIIDFYQGKEIFL